MLDIEDGIHPGSLANQKNALLDLNHTASHRRIDLLDFDLEDRPLGVFPCLRHLFLRGGGGMAKRGKSWLSFAPGCLTDASLKTLLEKAPALEADVVWTGCRLGAPLLNLQQLAQSST